jgi:hypothetical protein
MWFGSRICGLSTTQICWSSFLPQGRDLSPVTDELWRKCYSRKFGNDAVEMVKQRMADRKCKFKWKQLYQVQRWLTSWGDVMVCAYVVQNLRLTKE